MTEAFSPRTTADLRRSFEQAAARTRALAGARQLEVLVGCWHEALVLKLQKRAWSNATPEAGPAEAGIFFSVWIDDGGLRQKRVFYNIHALKLRALSAYALQSREFAAAFRSAFAGAERDWPHCSTDFGPQTLMQGWIDWVPARLEEDVAELVKRFLPLADLIDRLLVDRTPGGSVLQSASGRAKIAG